MRPEELSALGEVTGDAVRGAALQVHEVHAGIARRVWRSVGPISLPVRLAHDTITQASYRAVGEVGRALVRGGTGAMALAAAAAPGSASAGSLEDSSTGRAVVGALNGAFGDGLHARGNRLALPMTLRLGGAELALSPESLARAYPQASGRLVVFLQGLGPAEAA